MECDDDSLLRVRVPFELNSILIEFDKVGERTYCFGSDFMPFTAWFEGPPSTWAQTVDLRSKETTWIQLTQTTAGDKRLILWVSDDIKKIEIDRVYGSEYYFNRDVIAGQCTHSIEMNPPEVQEHP